MVQSNVSQNSLHPPCVLGQIWVHTVLHLKIHVYGLLQCVEGTSNNMGFILDWYPSGYRHVHLPIAGQKIFHLNAKYSADHKFFLFPK